MAAEEGQKWLKRRRQHPNSTEGAPNEPSRLKRRPGLTDRTHKILVLNKGDFLNADCVP